MKLVFYSVVLNHHQAPVADEFYKLLGSEYCFVELINLGDMKGATENYSKRPYLLRAWESEENHAKAMELAKTAECCVFGPGALEYQIARMDLGLLSFDMGERWLKQGVRNLLSPRLIKWHMNYHLRGWKHKPLYKLCMSAFAAEDHRKLGAFKGKCFKWGYFTSLGSYDDDTLRYDNDRSALPLGLSKNFSSTKTIRLMWCARFIEWKHPELAIKLAERLKLRGYSFQLELYGDGVMRDGLEKDVEKLGLTDVVKFRGNVPNDQIQQAMRESDIFLFTSDRQEGWGAVANEAMAAGCCLIASDRLGAAPYLIRDGINGFMFRDRDADSFCKIVKHVIDNPEERTRVLKQARVDLVNIWSPRNAAKSLLRVIEDLKNGEDTSIKEGPCSKA